jgi:dipeptidase E
MEKQLERLLLISNSTLYGSGYLDHCADEIRNFLGGVRRVLFLPFALYDRAAKARERLAAMGFALQSLHRSCRYPA